MTMTYREELGKRQIMKRLAQEGYPTYAKLLDKFDLNITNDSSVVAYMEPDKARIVVNSSLGIEGISMVIRHEILHQYLEHQARLIKHLANQAGLDYDTLSEMDLKKLQQQLYSNQIFNIAADYEISNRGYTDADKRTARNLYVNGEYVKGLVTELDHPDWVDLSVEEMYDKLNTEENRAKYQNQQQNQQGGDTDGQEQDGQDGQQQNQQSQGQQSKKKSPQIGDTGDPETQAKEEAERIAKAAKEMADEMSKGGTGAAGDSARDLKDVEAEAKNLVKDAKKMGKSGNITTDKEGEELAKRVKEIQDMFKDKALEASVIAETDKKIDQEKVDKRAKEIAAYKNSSIVRFKENLNRFIANEVDYSRQTSWKRFNKKYDGTGIMKPGISRHVESRKPLINVYFDQSGSWGEDDIKVGINAISVLNNYVKRGEIKVDIYYFSDNVHRAADSARAEGGTDLEAVFDHIKKTKPDNVIIMTDRDGDRSDLYPLEVPGAVWLLFRNSRSENVIANLHGKKQTKVFDLD